PSGTSGREERCDFEKSPFRQKGPTAAYRSTSTSFQRSISSSAPGVRLRSLRAISVFSDWVALPSFPLSFVNLLLRDRRRRSSRFRSLALTLTPQCLQMELA